MHRPLLTAAALFLSNMALGQVPRSLDPSRRELALTTQATDPRGVAQLHRALSREGRKALGLGPNDGLELASVFVDELGTVHARFRQRTHGILVRDAGAISHQRTAGDHLPYTSGAVSGIDTSPTPSLSRASAIAIAEADRRYPQPFASSPRVELVYVPVFTRVLESTGAPVPRSLDEGMLDPADESLQPEAVEKRLLRVHLAWEVRGLEGREAQKDFATRAFYVDARDGRVLDVRELDSHAVGTGFGQWNAPVSFQTAACGSGRSRMKDEVREFFTEDYDLSEGHAVNCDSNNLWGDGNPYLGDSSYTNVNRQTALVDGHFGATVYWDMMSNVFQRQGPDDHFYSVNIYPHYGVNWDNAKYSSWSGNVYLGDANGRTVVDCLGHELGHGFNDFNTNFNGPTQCLNESLADVMGEWTDAYLNGGGFSANASTLGTNSDPNWINRCSGRDLINPAANNHPSYWFDDIWDIEVHRGAGPSNRAFAFLARGASPFVHSRSYTPELPWGMTGIGLSKAARIFFLAHTGYMGPWGDHAQLRAQMIFCAQLLFGPGSVEEKAVRNAYAGIDLGSRAAGYPVGPSTQNEDEWNDDIQGAQLLSGAMSPPAGAVTPSPRKLRVNGDASSGSDWFGVNVPYGTPLGARLAPHDLPDAFAVEIWNAYGNKMASKQPIVIQPGSARIVNATCFGEGPTCRYYIHVKPLTVSAASGRYTLRIDLGN